MGKADFLAELRRALSSRLPEEELSDALAYYEEYFAEAGEDREEAVLQELGSPAAVAAKVLEDRGEDAPPVPEKSPSGPKRLALWGVGILIACGVLAAVLLALLPLGPEEGAPLYGVIAGSEGYSDELLDFDSIHRLEIDLPAAEVLIAPETEGTGLYVERWGDPNPNLYYDVENGTLRLWTEAWEADAEPSGGTVYLYMPQTLVWADIDLDLGFLSVHGLEVQDLDVTIGQGDAALERLVTGALEAEVGTGTLYLDHVRGGTLKGSVTRLGDQGGLEEHTPEALAEGDGTALVLEHCGAGVLELHARTGDMAAQGNFSEITLEAPKGSVYFSTARGRMEYEIKHSGGSELLVYHDVEGGGSASGGGNLQVQAKTAAYLHFAA